MPVEGSIAQPEMSTQRSFICVVIGKQVGIAKRGRTRAVEKRSQMGNNDRNNGVIILKKLPQCRRLIFLAVFLICGIE